MSGSYMYHCHVHTVKHLEMGMYGPMIVRPKDPNKAGAYLNQITDSPVTAYSFEKIYLFSTVDPAYHTAIQDDPVFADYNPKYFLINGAEGIRLINGAEDNTPTQNMNTAGALSAVTLAAKPNSKVALRLIGLHSVNGTFEIKSASGVPLSFTVYVQDGRAYPTPETVTSLDIAPAQRFDVIFTTPVNTGVVYPQMTYKKLRDSSAYATVYGKMTF
jgi:FtsP/CotA-like multicopper oxidase with cupredoxin domain